MWSKIPMGWLLALVLKFAMNVWILWHFLLKFWATFYQIIFIYVALAPGYSDKQNGVRPGFYAKMIYKQDVRFSVRFIS